MGYIITPSGASILLEYYNQALLVQVDALMGLVNRFDERFNLLWVRDAVVRKESVFRLSTIQTMSCPKCYHLDDYLNFENILCLVLGGLATLKYVLWKIEIIREKSLPFKI